MRNFEDTAHTQKGPSQDRTRDPEATAPDDRLPPLATNTKPQAVVRAWYSNSHGKLHPLAPHKSGRRLGRATGRLLDEDPAPRIVGSVSLPEIVAEPTVGPCVAVQNQVSHKQLNRPSKHRRDVVCLPPPFIDIWRALPPELQPMQEEIFEASHQRPDLALNEIFAEMVIGERKYRRMAVQCREARAAGSINLREVIGESEPALPKMAAIALLCPKTSAVCAEGMTNVAECLAMIAQMRNLQFLCLRNVKDLTDIDALATGSSRLVSIDLEGCTALASWAGLMPCNRLQTLSLAGCEGLEFGDAALPRWPSLRQLSLSSLQLTSLQPIAHLTGLRNLQLRSCLQLEDASHLVGLRSLEVVNFANCQELQCLCSLEKHSSLTCVDLGGCRSLPPPVVSAAWKSFDARVPNRGFFLWPSRRLADTWLAEKKAQEERQRRLFIAAKRSLAKRLRFAMSFRSGTDEEELVRAVAAAKEWGFAGRLLPLAVHRLAELGSTSPVIQLKISRSDFDRLLLARGYRKDQVQMLFGFLDTRSNGWVTKSNIDALKSAAGKASLSELCVLRRFLLARFGTLDNAFRGIFAAGTRKAIQRKGARSFSKLAPRLSGMEATISLEKFVLGMRNLGWPGGEESIRELFAALDDPIVECAPKHSSFSAPLQPIADGYLVAADMRLLDACFAALVPAGVEQLSRWVLGKFGSVKRAFVAIDTNSSGQVSWSEASECVEKYGHPDPDVAMKAFQFLDVDRSDVLLQPNEFAVCESFSEAFFMERLVEFIDWLREAFGDPIWSFDALLDYRCEIMQVEHRGGIDLASFRSALVGYKCPAVKDSARARWERGCGIRDPARVIFNYFDIDRTGWICREAWSSLLHCFKMKASQDGIALLKQKLLEDFGSFDGLQKALVELHLQAHEDESPPVEEAGLIDAIRLESLHTSCPLCRNLL